MIPVLWVPQRSRGSWDQGIVEELTAGPEYEHTNIVNKGSGAVIVLAGQHLLADAATLAASIASLPWSLTIVTSDEEALFPVEHLPHDEKHETWGQYHARPEFDRVIPIGAPPDSEFNCVGDRKPGVFFAGQDTHERRHELIDVMKSMSLEPDSYGDVGWVASTGFRQGLDRFDYKLALCFAAVAPCPSGPHSLDSFRLYEALAAGCLPVIEKRTPHGNEEEFWKAMFGAHPIPTVNDWSELVGLAPAWMKSELQQNWCNVIQDWWDSYRKRLALDFHATVERLSES